MDFQRIYDTTRLFEIYLNKNSFAFIVRNVFYKSLPPKIGIYLPYDFLSMLSKKIIETILKEDAESYDEGIVLYSDDGYLSRGAKSLTIRSFVDLVVSVCSRMAKNIYMKKTPLLSEYAKVFVQTFLENSAMNRSNRTWRKTFADNLTKELENVERLVIKYR